MASVADGVEDHKTDTGRMKVSLPELTALDVLRYPRAASGLDNIATVLADLAASLNPEKLAALSQAFEQSVVQRLGHLLDRLGHDARADLMHSTLSARGTIWVELDPIEASDRDFAPDPVQRDDRWRVVVRRIPEADQ